MPDLVQILIQDALKRTIKHYGLEGTIECIERVYGHNPQAKSRLLEELNKKFEKNK